MSAHKSHRLPQRTTLLQYLVIAGLQVMTDKLGGVNWSRRAKRSGSGLTGTSVGPNLKTLQPSRLWRQVVIDKLAGIDRPV